MALREVVYESLSADEICMELYGVAKGGLLVELAQEKRKVRALSKYRRQGAARTVPGPTLQAMITPGFRHYVEGGRHEDP